MPIVSSASVDEALEAFENRGGTGYESMARSVARLAEALSRTGRFAMQDKVLDVAVSLEGMYELPRRGKSYKLRKRVANFLGTDAFDRERISETIRRFYQVRSEIVHSGSGEALPFRKEAAFVAGFMARRASMDSFRWMDGERAGARRTRNTLPFGPDPTRPSGPAFRRRRCRCRRSDRER